MSPYISPCPSVISQQAINWVPKLRKFVVVVLYLHHNGWGWGSAWWRPEGWWRTWSLPWGSRQQAAPRHPGQPSGTPDQSFADLHSTCQCKITWHCYLICFSWPHWPVVEANQGRYEQHCGQHQVVRQGEGNVSVIHNIFLEDFWYVLITGSRFYYLIWKLYFSSVILLIQLTHYLDFTMPMQCQCDSLTYSIRTCWTV